MSRSRRLRGGMLSGERLIRAGAVRFFGKTYRVEPTQRPPENAKYGRGWQSDPPYDGRLDGRRALFTHYGPSSPRLADSIFLHSVPPANGETWPGLNCIDGYYAWERWKEVVA